MNRTDTPMDSRFAVSGENGNLRGMLQTITDKSDHLYVEVTGEFSLKEAEMEFLDILDAVAQYKHNNVLFDGRGVTGEPVAMERFCYGLFVAEAAANFRAEHNMPDLKFAYILLEPVLDPNRLGENVAVNRGMWVKTFDNLEDAMAWLEPGPPGQV